MSVQKTITMVPGIPQAIPIDNPQTLQAIKLSNTSPFNVYTSGIGGQGVQHIAAGVEVWLDAKIENQGTLTLTANNDYNINGTGVVILNIYSIGETLPQGHWPVTIPVQIVQAKVSTVTTLVNDGSSVGTQVIEMTPAGAASSTVSILNDGTVVIKGDVATVLTTLLQLIPGAAAAASSVKLGDAARTVEILGKLLVDGTTELKGATTVDAGGLNVSAGGIGVIGASSLDSGSILTDGNGNFTALGNLLFTSAKLLIQQGGSTVFDATNTHDIIINAPNAGGTGAVKFSKGGVDTGVKIDNNGVNWPNGNFLPNISFFTGSGSGTYNHTFGGSPFWVCPIVDVVGSATQGYDTVTSTQVHVTLGAVLAFKAFCA